MNGKCLEAKDKVRDDKTLVLTLMRKLEHDITELVRETAEEIRRRGLDRNIVPEP